ncbi:MAG: LysR family transcriptional regulator [Rhizobiales bacterium]|nr:LysR family transcriptional regulator [Hyphomicrobiales bacterium]
MHSDNLPPLNWLRAFEASARNLSFTGAARDLNMTQSAVSQQIKALENHLGRSLFVRRTRALQLTEAGLNYLPTVQEAFSTLAAGTRALIGGDRGRRLSVQSNLAFSVFWLTPRLPRLYAQHPWLTLNITTTLWDMVEGITSPDVEIRFGRDLDGARVTRLSKDTCFAVCSPEIAARGADWRTEQLFDCAGMISGWDAWAAEQGERLPDGKAINIATTFVISLGAALAGAGMAMAHETVADQLLADARLVRAGDHIVAMQDAYYLASPAKHAETPASRAFNDWLLAEIAG